MIEFKPPKSEYRELWKQIKDTNEMYWVSDKGRVFSKHRNKILSQYIINGYPNVKIMNKDRRVHRLVMEAFKPIENSKEMYVNHIDLDKLNSCISNLEWVTPRENCLHYFQNNKVNRTGKNSPNAKLTEEIVKEIRDSYNPDEHTLSSLGEKHQVSRQSIVNILANVTWHDELYVPVYERKHNPNNARYENSNNRSKLTKKDVFEIREMFEENPNLRINDISKKFGVSNTAISDVLSRRTWTHI